MTSSEATPEARPGLTRFVAGRVAEAVTGLVLLAAAAALALAGAPTWVRVVVTLPVVVAVAGRAVSLLVLGRSLRPAGSAPAYQVDDSLLRGVAPLLFGVIAVLTATLLAGLVGLSITTDNVILAVAGLAGALHVLAAVGRRHERHHRRSFSSSGQTFLRVVVPATVAVAVLVGGVVVGRSVEASPVERYTQLSLVDPTFYATGRLQVAAGGTLTMGWILRSYDLPLPAQPEVSMTIGGRAATKLTQRLLPASADPTDATASLRGQVTATVPTKAGLYRVVLRVGDQDAVRTINLVLQVTS